MKHSCSEPCEQEQDRARAERETQALKRDVAKLLDGTGTPDRSWLCCLRHLSALHDHATLKKLGCIAPQQKSARGAP